MGTNVYLLDEAAALVALCGQQEAGTIQVIQLQGKDFSVAQWLVTEGVAVWDEQGLIIPNTVLAKVVIAESHPQQP